MKATTAERIHEKYESALCTTLVTAPSGQQLRVTLPAGELVATWITKNDRLSYASGFLFAKSGLKKLTARDVTATLDEAVSSRSARR